MLCLLCRNVVRLISTDNYGGGGIDASHASRRCNACPSLWIHLGFAASSYSHRTPREGVNPSSGVNK
jgi:hypothetical protein